MSNVNKSLRDSSVDNRGNGNIPNATQLGHSDNLGRVENSTHSDNSNHSNNSDHSDHSSHSYFLQQNNIYWETGHRTYIPFFHPLIRKHTTKIIDDQIRKYFNEVKSVNSIPFVFHKDGYFRNYYSDPDVNMVHDIKKNTNYVFNCTGAIRYDDILKQNPVYEKSSYIFDEIMMSAYKMDLKKLLLQDVQAKYLTERKNENIFTSE